MIKSKLALRMRFMLIEIKFYAAEQRPPNQ